MTEDSVEQLANEVAQKARRKERARQTKDRDVWSWLGMFGLVGWSVAIPTLIGVALGIWLDRLRLSRISWTLSLLIVGMALGCVNAWYWIKQEGKRD